MVAQLKTLTFLNFSFPNLEACFFFDIPCSGGPRYDNAWSVGGLIIFPHKNHVLLPKVIWITSFSVVSCFGVRWANLSSCLSSMSGLFTDKEVGDIDFVVIVVLGLVEKIPNREHFIFLYTISRGCILILWC